MSPLNDPPGPPVLHTVCGQPIAVLPVELDGTRMQMPCCLRCQKLGLPPNELTGGGLHWPHEDGPRALAVIRDRYRTFDQHEFTSERARAQLALDFGFTMGLAERLLSERRGDGLVPVEFFSDPSPYGPHGRRES